MTAQNRSIIGLPKHFLHYWRYDSLQRLRFPFEYRVILLSSPITSGWADPTPTADEMTPPLRRMGEPHRNGKLKSL